MSSPTATKPLVTREIHQILLSKEQAEGVGARVRRSIGRPELRNFDPFLMLDEAHIGSEGGFPDHPHRGIQTVSYSLPDSTGSFEHEDFTGAKGVLKPGTVQWMNAGRGIVHSELPKNGPGEVAHGLQLWITLPRKEKMSKPWYQELAPEKFPTAKKDGVEARIISGSAFGTVSPINISLVPVHYIHFFMEAHQTFQQPIPNDFNSFLYTLGGKISVGTPNEKKLIEAHHTVTLTREKNQEGITITTYDEPANFVFLAGKILNEPIVQHGPFVMNTREEIMQAFRDYQEGKNGFENAPGWRSEIGRKFTDKMNQYDDDE